MTRRLRSSGERSGEGLLEVKKPDEVDIDEAAEANSHGLPNGGGGAAQLVRPCGASRRSSSPRRPGPTNFPRRTSSPPTTIWSAPGLADVDGDGDVDFAAFDATVAWYANVALSFSANVIGTAADDARGVFALDLDGDGDVDALSASIGDATVAWYENDGAESFTERIITTLAEHAVDVPRAPGPRRVLRGRRARVRRRLRGGEPARPRAPSRRTSPTVRAPDSDIVT
ncbi:hypothetical protein JL722_3016 [Aureococcus anophagefferens]|nr:hypothetical protein JL722_3016 [Aureococcus anophagefferens]